jgi:predicted RNA-binding protein YlqC (UPF0109 family)
MKMGLSKGQNRIELGIPHNMIGLVIGKNGETVKSINARTGVIFLLIITGFCRSFKRA